MYSLAEKKDFESWFKNTRKMSCLIYVLDLIDRLYISWIYPLLFFYAKGVYSVKLSG